MEVVKPDEGTVEEGDDPPGAEEGAEELDESSVVKDCRGADERVADGRIDEGVADGEADEGVTNGREDEGDFEIGLLEIGWEVMGYGLDDGTASDESTEDGGAEDGSAEDGIAEGLTEGDADPGTDTGI